eukprot:5009452-Karenia_brevis.AAC.1
MRGIEDGIDREATLHLLRRKKLSHHDKGVLRSILAGGFVTQHRLYRAGLTSSGVCPFCDVGVQETVEHVWWGCPAWARTRHRCNSRPLRHELWPPCFTQCGIMPEAGVLGSSEFEDTSDEEPPTDMDDTAIGEASCPLETVVNDRVVVYTDGACRHNQNSKLRRAGVGAFWGPKHAKNISTPLSGAVQTNQRAEMMAVLLAVRAESRNMEIR